MSLEIQPAALAASIHLFQELSRSSKLETWLELYPIIQATNNVLSHALESWGPAAGSSAARLEAQFATPSLQSAWFGAVVAGCRVVAAHSHTEIPGLAVQAVATVVTALSDFLFAWHGKNASSQMARLKTAQQMASSGEA